MDGTLYDNEDIIKVNYEMVKDYLLNNYEFEEDIDELLTSHHLYPYISDNAGSITSLFKEMNFDTEAWDRYRSEAFDFSLIDKDKAVSEDTLKELSLKAPLVLLSNNTSKNVEATLNRLEISPNVFKDIVLNEGEQKYSNKGPLIDKIVTKYHLPYNEVLAIGDRYIVDGKPLVERGGSALIIKRPSAFKKVIEDFNNFKSCDEYQFIQ